MKLNTSCHFNHLENSLDWLVKGWSLGDAVQHGAAPPEVGGGGVQVLQHRVLVLQLRRQLADVQARREVRHPPLHGRRAQRRQGGGEGGARGGRVVLCPLAPLVLVEGDPGGGVVHGGRWPVGDWWRRASTLPPAPPTVAGQPHTASTKPHVGTKQRSKGKERVVVGVEVRWRAVPSTAWHRPGDAPSSPVKSATRTRQEIRDLHTEKSYLRKLQAFEIVPCSEASAGQISFSGNSARSWETSESLTSHWISLVNPSTPTLHFAFLQYKVGQLLRIGSV